MQRSIFDNEGDVTVPDAIDKQVSAPSVALSGSTSEEHEKQMIDSLNHVEKKMEVEKR